MCSGVTVPIHTLLAAGGCRFMRKSSRQYSRGSSLRSATYCSMRARRHIQVATAWTSPRLSEVGWRSKMIGLRIGLTACSSDHIQPWLQSLHTSGTRVVNAMSVPDLAPKGTSMPTSLPRMFAAPELALLAEDAVDASSFLAHRFGRGAYLRSAKRLAHGLRRSAGRPVSQAHCHGMLDAGHCGGLPRQAEGILHYGPAAGLSASNRRLHKALIQRGDLAEGHYSGMANRRQRKLKRARQRLSRTPTRSKARTRPTPLQAVELHHAKQARMLAARNDRFSQLLSGLLKDEETGQYVVTRSGLSEEEWGELRSLAPEAHAGFRTELLEAINRLRQLLTLGDPLYIATMVQLSNLFGEWGTYYEPMHQGMETKVELVVGLLATQPSTGTLGEPTDAEMQRIHDELDHILEVLLLYNVSRPRGDDHDIAMLRITGAMRWMMLRGSSYGQHGQDLARAVYGPHNEWMLARSGFTIDDVVDLGLEVESLVNRRINELRNQATGFADNVLKQLRSEGIKGRLPAEVKEQLSTADGPFQVRGRAFVDVLQHGLREALTFSASDLAPNDVVRRERFAAALKELAVAVGSLDPSAYTGLFDESPFFERPFLEFNGRYLLAIPGIVLRDPVALLEDRLMKGKDTFSKARAKALDALAVKYLSNMLPGSVTYTNLSYEGAELDGLVLFEDIAFVVEGKGGALSVQAQRGDVERLKSDIGEAVEFAWEQGARAREFILRDGDTVFRDENAVEIRIPAGSVREVIIVNPTLHELAGHAPQLGRLRALGLFPDGELPWSVYINDLRVIAETCGNAGIFLHYLVWRNRLPLGERITVDDEIDLWGCYLNCERFGMLAANGKAIVGNSSTDFDSYYNGLVGHGPKQKAPRKFMCEPISAFVDRMSAERPAGWRDAAGACLDLSIPELAFTCAKAKDVARHATHESQPVWVNMGRVSLVGIPREADIATVLAQPAAQDSDPTLVIYCREATSKRTEIVWAKYAKPVTFELSDFEEAAFKAAHARHAQVRAN